MYTCLAVFKPTGIINSTAGLAKREWDKDKLAKLNQLNLFKTNKEGKFDVVQKLPYKFKFIFKDIEGKESRMMIEDWETGQLYWDCLKRHDGNEKKATTDVRNKYFYDFAKTKDLHFFRVNAGPSSCLLKPSIITGTFQPKKQIQQKLF